MMIMIIIDYDYDYDPDDDYDHDDSFIFCHVVQRWVPQYMLTAQGPIGPIYICAQGPLGPVQRLALQQV